MRSIQCRPRGRQGKLDDDSSLQESLQPPRLFEPGSVPEEALAPERRLLLLSAPLELARGAQLHKKTRCSVIDNHCLAHHQKKIIKSIYVNQIGSNLSQCVLIIWVKKVKK